MEAHLSRSVRFRLLVDEREPRNRRLGARLQLAENLLSLLIKLGVGGFELMFRLCLNLGAYRPSHGNGISQTVQAIVNFIEFNQI